MSRRQKASHRAGKAPAWAMARAQGRLAAAYDRGAYKNNDVRIRSYNRDMSFAGPYARNIESYDPRKNDWPGVDDTGILLDGSRVPVTAWEARERRVLRRTPALVAAQKARREAADRRRIMFQGGYSAPELRSLAKQSNIAGRSKMGATELWHALGRPVAPGYAGYSLRAPVKYEDDDDELPDNPRFKMRRL